MRLCKHTWLPLVVSSCITAHTASTSTSVFDEYVPSMNHSPGDPESLPGTRPVKSPPRPPASPHSWLRMPLITLFPVIPCDLGLRSVTQEIVSGGKGFLQSALSKHLHHRTLTSWSVVYPDRLTTHCLFFLLASSKPAVQSSHLCVCIDNI